MSESDLVARTEGRADDGLVGRLSGLLAAAAPLPWYCALSDRVQSTVTHSTVVDGVNYVAQPFVCVTDSGMEEEPDDEMDEANAALIAEGVSALPALLADNEDKRQESATYKAMALKAEHEAQRHFDRAAAALADNERLTAENANLRESAETAVFVANANTESLRIWQERYETLSLHHSAEAARADAAEARLTQLERELRMHHYEIPGGWCNSDGFAWPCVTERALVAASVVSEAGDTG